MSTSVLKIIALISMTIDHIGSYFPNIPGSDYFRWIGRLAIPIFMYCLVVGFINTSNKKMYYIRLFLFNIVMSVLLMFIPSIHDNIITTFIYIFSIMLLIEKCNTDKNGYKRYIIYFLIFKLSGYILSFLIYQINIDLHLLICRVFFLLPVVDGGLIYVLLGIAMYKYYDNKKMLTCSFIIFSLIILIARGTDILVLISHKLDNYNTLSVSYILLLKILLGIERYNLGNNDIWFNYCNWMFILALPIIFSYNSKKGKKLKYLFYIYYPLHKLVLIKIAELIM